MIEKNGTGPSNADEGWLLVALLALAFNLRSPITAVAPLLADIRNDLGISKTVAGLLTSIPVFCFGFLAPLASRLIARSSTGHSILLTLVGVIVGIAIRPCGGIELALAGTVLIGVSLTIGNIATMVLIAREFPGRMTTVTGLFTTFLNIGPTVAAATAEPVAKLIGWRWSLGGWAIFPAIALAIWMFVLNRAARRSGDAPQSDSQTAELLDVPEPEDVVHVLRRPIVWLLMVAFAAHLMNYYGLAAWLPEYLRVRGGLSPTGAGLAAAFFQSFALLGTTTIPILATRGGISQHRLLLIIGLAWITTTAGLLLAPRLWPLWSVSGGFASGGGITTIFMLGMTAARGLDDNRRVSAAIQGLGYALAATGPVVMGALNERTGSWTAGMSLLIGLSVIITLVATRTSAAMQTGR